jgi:hypothetical protein
MKKFIRKEAIVLFKALSLLFMTWCLCCLWNGIWGLRMDTEQKEIAGIYISAEADELALTDSQDDQLFEADSTTFSSSGFDSSLVDHMSDCLIPAKNLLLDSTDISKIELLNKKYAFARRLMIEPPQLFILMFFVLACILLIFYPIRVIVLCFRHLPAILKHE